MSKKQPETDATAEPVSEASTAPPEIVPPLRARSWAYLSPEHRGGYTAVELCITHGLPDYSSIKLGVTVGREFTGQPGDALDDAFKEALADAKCRLYGALVDEVGIYANLRDEIPKGWHALKKIGREVS